MADNAISNEDIYRESWATFVDATIENHWASDGKKLCEERVGLQDLIQLDEVLSKLTVQENPVPISNCGSTSFSSEKGQVHTRKPLAIVSGMPPLFENPLPSFFASMTATTVMNKNDVGHRVGPSLSCEVDPTEGAVRAQASKHLAEQLAEAASREIDRILSQEGRYGDDSNAPRSVPSEKEGEHPAQVRIKDHAPQRDPGPNHDLVETQNMVDADTTVILQDGGKPEAIEAPIEALEWEDPPHGTESPRLIEPQNIGSATHAHVMDSRRPPQIEARPVDDHNTPKSPNIAEQTLVLEEQSPPDSRSTCSLAREASPGPSFVDVMSLSAHLDAIQIKIESGSGPDESFYAASSTVPQEQDSGLEVTMLEASRCHTDEGCYADGAESFIGYARSDKDKDKLGKSTSIVHANDPLMNKRPLSWTRASDKSEEREQLNIDACGEILDESEIQVYRIESGNNREAGSNSSAALSLSQHQSLGEGATSTSGQRSCLQDASLENGDSGASQYHTSDSVSSVGKMDIHVKPCEVVENFHLMSLTGGVGGVSNSECSPAIVGFQFDGDAPSPLPLVEPNFVDERSDEHGEGDISQARSTGSESTLEPNEATVERYAVAAIYDGEEIPETPLLESPSLHPDDPEECESKGSVCTPSPQQRQEGFESSVRLLTPEMQLPGIVRDLSDFDDRGSFPPDICPVASPAAGLVQEERDSPSGLAVKSSYEDDGDEACCEHTSVGSFSDSEKSQSRIDSDCERGQQGEPKEADASLVEGTPRRHRCGSQENLAGFYAPLMVTNIAGAPKDISLTITQKSTLHWMAWREGTDETIRGGILGHLATEEASICIATLVRNAPRLGFGTAQVRDKASLPRGGTLLIAPTKNAAEEWIDRLGGGARLSVMSYLMPLKERRRLKAEQAATFDAVVTTYDILKAKEVAMTSAVKDVTNTGVWHTRKAQKDRRRVSSKTNSMVSLLHGIWWDRVVADGAQILANPLSARVMAMAGLVGGVRWCVVGRESMSTVESASERMRSLTAFLGVPSEVPLVDVADCLFYRSRPRHIAPVLYRNTDDEATSSGDEAQRSEGLASNTRPQQRTLVDPAGMAERIVGRGQGKGRLSRGRRSQQRRDWASANRPSCDESVGMRDTCRPSRRDEVRQYVPTVLQLVKSRDVRPAPEGPSTDGV